MGKSKQSEEMDMIKQIVDFNRLDEGEEGSVEIELYVFTDDPKQTDEIITELIGEYGATIDSADPDTVRATIKGTTQTALWDLLNDGWSFSDEVN